MQRNTMTYHLEKNKNEKENNEMSWRKIYNIF